jgi:hypothetical protein
MGWLRRVRYGDLAVFAAIVVMLAAIFIHLWYRGSTS